MKKISFEEAKMLQYELLKEVHSVCEKYNLTYFLAFGTLIGAIRHNGYIPWDDDIDILMPYNDFLQLSSLYQSDKYSIKSCIKDEEYGSPIGRLYDDRTISIKGPFVTLGLSIDIYPLFGGPTDRNEMEKHCKLLTKYNKWRRTLRKFRNGLAKYYMWPKRTMSFGLLHKLCVFMIKQYSIYPYENSKYVIIGGATAKPYDKKNFEKRELHLFEDQEFYIPTEYHKLLSGYGDYMKLPPLKERKPYHGIDHCYWK